MKSLDDNKDDIRAIFYSIWNRINEDRIEPITILDKEVNRAVKDYVKTECGNKKVIRNGTGTQLTKGKNE